MGACSSSQTWRRRIESQPEDIVFDKAEQAGKAEQLKMERERLAARIDELKRSLHDAPEQERPAMQQEMDAAQLERRENMHERTRHGAAPAWWRVPDAAVTCRMGLP